MDKIDKLIEEGLGNWVKNNKLATGLGAGALGAGAYGLSEYMDSDVPAVDTSGSSLGTQQEIKAAELERTVGKLQNAKMAGIGSGILGLHAAGVALADKKGKQNG